MTIAVRLARIVVAALVCAAVLIACVRTAEVRYFTLTIDGPARPARREPARYTVRVAPASVPETLDRPELVLRVSATELAIDDRHRWAEPLRTGIARAVAGDLARQLDGALVAFAQEGDGDGITRGTTADVEVAIDVQRLDVKLGDGVGIDVAWAARWTDDRHTRAGRSVARARAAPGGGYDAVVIACAEALSTLSNDIARSVRAEYASRR
jgi:uncharacterized lipoprotein YmbA